MIKTCGDEDDDDDDDDGDDNDDDDDDDDDVVVCFPRDWNEEFQTMFAEAQHGKGL